MNFASDNWHGVPDEMIEGLRAAGTGTAAVYGSDEFTRSVEQKFAEVFETDVAVFLVATGTAANALALASVTPPYGAVFCHPHSHILADECGAVEFYSGGARLVPVPGETGKISPEALRAAITRQSAGGQHAHKPAAVSITQASEAGTVYSAGEIAALGEAAREAGLKLHMDGARFANALAALDCSPAGMSWRAGVDLVSFGATKNGALAAEAVIAFGDSARTDLTFRRKQAGHLISKSRFIATQFAVYLHDDLWIRLAAHANAMARRLGGALAATRGVRLAFPVEANEIFAILPFKLDAALRAAGAVYKPWPVACVDPGKEPGEDEVLVRLVTAFATRQASVDRFIDLLREHTAR